MNQAFAVSFPMVLLLSAGFVNVGLPGLPGDDGWRSKADAPLLDAYDGGAETFDLILQGPEIPDPTSRPQTRADWQAHWRQHAAPFAASVRGQVSRSGGDVTLEVPAANVVHAVVPRDAVPALLGRDDVRSGALDWVGATRILGGVVDTPPSVLVGLDQSIAKVEAPAMHALGYRGEGIKLAMIDTGIRHTHEMLKNADGTSRVTGWYDATTAGCVTPCDTNGHGTHVTTTAAGSNLFNAASQQGVAPRAEIYGIKIFIGGGGSWEDAQEGLQAAFDLGADITSNSWGGGCSGGGITTAELAEDLQAAGMMNVFASGNSGTGGHICPGMVDNVASIGAIDIGEVVAGFSSRGPCTWPVGGGATRTCPDVMAVGVDVTAGWWDCDTCYVTISGTSMATPHVAGVATLLEQAKLDLKGVGMSAADKEAEILLRYTAKDLGASGPDNDYGWGLAKAAAAYAVLNAPPGVNLADLFGGGVDIRSYQTNNLFFAIANLGSVSVSGHVTHRVEQLDTGFCPPSCEVVTITDADVTLDPLREVASSYVFSGAAHAAGTYRVTGRLDYTYVDPDTGETVSGSLEREATFLVKKVFIVKTRTGVPAQALPGTLVLAGLSLVNLGNEAATGVTFEEKFNPQGFHPVPTVPPGSPPNGLFADPAPDRVTFFPVLAAREVRYEWNGVGTLAPGQAWSAAYNALALRPGTYAFTGTLRYQDEIGTAFSEVLAQDSVVG